jgi:amino acid transporter
MQRVTLEDLPRTSPLNGLRRRELSYPEVLAQSVAALAPSAVMVAVPPLVLSQAGTTALPALLAASALALLVGWSLTQFARRMGTVGGLYTYAVKGLGRGGGLVAGWCLLLAYATVTAAALVGAAAYGAGLLRLPPTPTVVGVLVLGVGGLATLLTIRGIQLSARVALALEVASIVMVTVVLVLLLLARTGDPTTPGAMPNPVFTWGGFALAVVLGVAGFMGFESATTLGVEAARPLRSIPRALLWTPAVAAVLLLAAAGAQTRIIGDAPAGILSSPVPILAIAQRDGFGWAATLLGLGIVSSFLAAATGALNALGRVLFTLGREGVAPRALGRTHPRWGTPHIALVMALPPVVGVPVVLLATGQPPLGVFVGALTIAALGYLVAYVLSCLAMPVFLHRIGELTWVPAVAGGAGAVLCSTVLAGAVAGSWQVDGGRTTALFAALVLPGLPWVWWSRSHADTVGVHDETTRSAVLPGSIPTGRG